jgi:DNA repair protein RecN (Recombination protein N)
MLYKLYIKDYAIVDEIEVYFSPGFQVITGETGAGKSVLIGALGLICGGRAQSELIRAGAKKSILEAEFKLSSNSDVIKILKDLNIEDLKEILILRREINDRGISRAYINDSPVTINDLNRISDLLIDLHGQHQHQRLLKSESHIYYLDAYGKLESMVRQFRLSLQRFNEVKENLDSLRLQKEKNLEKYDLYNFQINELVKANLQEDELEKLSNERKILENSETLFEITHAVSDVLYSSEDSALKKVMLALNQFKNIVTIDASFSELLQGLESMRVTIEEIGRFCEVYSTKLEFDPLRLEEIRARETEIEWFLKKYHFSSISELRAHMNEMKKQIKFSENFDEEIGKIEAQLEKDRIHLQELALDLADKRKTVAAEFALKLGKILSNVGLPAASFSVQINWREGQNGIVNFKQKKYNLNDSGLDTVEFFVGLNIGEPVRPLHKIASGGEVSRIMLSIKSLLAKVDEINTLVFDEIDSGISGKFAQIVGKELCNIGSEHQLIVITHLPQIAAQGSSHYSVNKMEHNGRTKVVVKKLNYTERINDIAKLLGGEKVTSRAIDNARELLTNPSGE